MNKAVAIIIPVHNAINILGLSIKSIFESTKYPFYLLLIESESDDGSAELVDKMAESNIFIKSFHIKKEGGQKAINYGMDKARELGDLDVFITHSDCIFPKMFKRDWLKEMVDISKFEDAGIITFLNHGGISNSEYIEKFKWVGTWCMYLPRRTLEEVGYFDPEFFPDCGDDVDYTYRTISKGFKIYVIDYWVDHHMTGSNRNDGSDHCKMGGIKFRKKHGLGEFADESKEIK